MQFYCISLAQKGYAVTNFSYRLAPKHKHPTPFIDANTIFTWIFENANKYDFDTNNIFAVGDSVLIAPNVTIATANHTLEPELRRYEMQYVRDVHIGENTWIGAGAIILPGVHIGKNCVIGAGSVVTRDIPDNSLAFGNPCRVIREINDYDKNHYNRNEVIDWENLQEHIDIKKEKWSKK